jgi:uncharacterized repeat protein (TIGR01451 family)/fimbrial isopeptide formation D2 family protein
LNSRASRSPFRTLPILVAFFVNLVAGPLAPLAGSIAHGAVGMNLDQCANGAPPGARQSCTGANWQNGNLNGSNSQYREGDSVAFRTEVSGLTAGTTYQVDIGYDNTDNGKHAYDYLTSWNRTESGDPCSDRDCSGAPTELFPIPTDPMLATAVPPVTQAPGDFAVWGGNITSVVYTQLGTPVEANHNQTIITITFVAGDDTVLFAWGGHIATEVDWGVGDGASAVSGSPYHMRMEGVWNADRSKELTGNAQQDRSLKADAILLPPFIATQVSASTVNLGSGTVTDTATLTPRAGRSNTLTGSVTFWLCGPGLANAVTPLVGCPTGGTQVGGAVAVAGNAATSAAFDPTQAGFYCFRAQYTPDAESADQYVAASHTNATTECFTVTAAPILSVTKTGPTPSTVNAGDSYSYVIRVTNSGNAAATNVTVTDDLNDALTVNTVTPSAGSCLAVGLGNTISCNVGTLAAGGGSATVTINVTVPAAPTLCGSVVNTSHAAADNHTSVDSNTVTVTVTCPNIRVEKEPDEGDGNDVNAGDPATFTITVHNDGNGAATNVNLFDDLPGTGWSVVGAQTTLTNCQVTDPTTGDHAALGEILTCGPDTIGPSPTSKKVTVTKTTVNPGDCGEMNNTASVTVGNGAGDSDTGNIDVLCGALRVEKEPDEGDAGSVVNAGGTATFTITVHNDGTGTANNVTLFDDLPGSGWSVDAANTTLTGCAVTDPSTGEHADDGEILTCGPDTIGPSPASKKVTVTNPIGVAECADLDNLASASSSNAGSADDDGFIEVTCPDLEVEKTPDENEEAPGANDVNAGDPATYLITVTNVGDGDAEGVELFDDLPGSGWSVVGAETTLTDCAVTDPVDGEHAALGEILTCGPDTIEPGEANAKWVTVTKTTVNPDDCNGLPNLAEVTADNDEGDENAGDIDVLCPSLEIEKEATDPEINADDEASYTITVTNDGNGDATGVTITDDLPDGLTWTEDSEFCEIDLAGDLLCEDITILAHTDFSVTVTGTSDSGDCPSIENTAEFDSENAGSGSSDSDDRGPTLITINCPDLEVTKEQVDANGDPIDEPVDAGLTAYFAIHVTNHGLGDAYDVVVTDNAPEGTIWTVVDDGGFTCDDEVGGGFQVITCTADVMAVGSATILISYETVEVDCPLLENAVSVAAVNEPAEKVGDDNAASAEIVVECPGLNIVKTADADPIDAGDEGSFTITVWNAGDGDAFDVVVEDTIPLGWSFDGSECDSVASSVEVGEPETWTCHIDVLGVTDMAGGVEIRVFGPTDRTDCGEIENDAFVFASNQGTPVTSNLATITVACPEITLEKANDAVGSVLPGTTVTYTLTLTVDVPELENGEAESVVVTDTLPVGLEDPTNISDGGAFDDATRTITWDLGDLAEGEYTLTYEATVADDVENGEELVNAAAATSTNSQCPDLETLGPECEAESTVVVRVPTLVIDKVASVEEITISGPANAQTADPSVVTWTLTYTLTNGPVTNAVITDEVPTGFIFLDASDDGQLVDSVVTWTFLELTESGSVTFRTTVDVATISRTDPTVNVAVIVSDQTPEDEGEDEVSVVVEPPVLGGTPPQVPDTALTIGPAGDPITIPVELMAALLLTSLGALAYANVRVVRRRG